MKEVKEYWNNGQLRRHFWLNDNGEIEGEYKSWWSNGQLWTHCFFKNGSIQGEYKSWLSNGQLAIHCFFKNGLKEGVYKSWDSNGQLTAHRFFHNDKEIDIFDYVQDVYNITECEYFQLQLTFGYFPIFKFDGNIQINYIK